MFIEEKSFKNRGEQMKMYLVCFETEEDQELFQTCLKRISSNTSEKLLSRITDKYCANQEHVIATTVLYQSEMKDLLYAYLISMMENERLSQLLKEREDVIREQKDVADSLLNLIYDGHAMLQQFGINVLPEAAED